jgi:hypothetical protein
VGSNKAASPPKTLQSRGTSDGSLSLSATANEAATHLIEVIFLLQLAGLLGFALFELDRNLLAIVEVRALVNDSKAT